jgi:hypothetical protein
MPLTPSLGSPTVSLITVGSAVLGGSVTTGNGSPTIAIGIVYAPASAGTGVLTLNHAGATTIQTSSFAQYGSTGAFSFHFPVSGLSAGVLYNFVAVAGNVVGGNAYSSVGHFSTLSQNCNLSGLSIFPGTLTPGFDPSTTSYSVLLPVATTSAQLTATRQQNNATIKINGQTASSGGLNTLTLVPGANVVPVLVTAQDGVTTQTYTVTVNCGLAPVVSSPTSSDVTSTTVTLGGNVTSDGGSTITDRGIVVGYSAINSDTATGTPSKFNQTPIIGGPNINQYSTSGTTGAFTLSAADYLGGPISIIGGVVYSFAAYATNAAGTTYSDYAKFTTVGADGFISSFKISKGDISPLFNPGVFSYTSTVPNSVSEISICPTPLHRDTVCSINGNPAVGGTGYVFPLVVGSNVFTVIGVSGNGSNTRTYTLTVTRSIFQIQVNSPLAYVIGGKFGNQLVYGNTGLNVQEAGDITTDRFGVSAGTCVFVSPKNNVLELSEQFLHLGVATHPYANWLVLTNKRVVMSPGVSTVVCTFEGIKNPSEFIYSFEAGATQEPIQTHPNFIILGQQYGVWTVTDPNTQVSNIVGGVEGGILPSYAQLYQGQFGGFRTTSKLAGLENYLDFGGATWSATQATPEPPTNALATIGHISVPLGTPPIFDDGRSVFFIGRGPKGAILEEIDSIQRNWLYMGMNFTQRGSAYMVTHNWLLSGPGGWNPLIYSNVPFDLGDVQSPDFTL